MKDLFPALLLFFVTGFVTVITCLSAFSDGVIHNQKEAIKNHVAHYEVDNDGNTSFHWDTTQPANKDN